MKDQDNRLICETYNQIVEISLDPTAPQPDQPYNNHRNKPTDQLREPVPGSHEMIELWDDGEGEEENIGFMIRNDLDLMFPSPQTRDLIQRELKMFEDSYGDQAAESLRQLIIDYFKEQYELWAHDPEGDHVEHEINEFLRDYKLITFY